MPAEPKRKHVITRLEETRPTRTSFASSGAEDRRSIHGPAAPASSPLYHRLGEAPAPGPKPPIHEADRYAIHEENPHDPGYFARVGDARVDYSSAVTAIGPRGDRELTEPMRPGEADSGRQLGMFRYKHHPAQAVVSLMQMSRGSNYLTPALLGMMQNRSAELHGVSLSTPTSLSPHSSKLIKGLQGRGLVDPKATNRVSNELDFIEDPKSEFAYAPAITGIPGGKTVSAEERSAGYKTTRSIVRANRKSRRQPPVEEQQSLPLGHMSEQMSMYLGGA